MSGTRRFIFLLALESGYWVYNPDAMANAMPARILQEWVAFYNENPLLFTEGREFRSDVRSGIISSVLVNINTQKGSRKARINDFLAKKYIIGATQTKTDKERVEQAIAIARMMGAEVIKK